MRVLLTGATGYIGGSVMETFLRAGHAVTVLARNPGRVATSVGEVRVVRADLGRPADWAAAADGHEVFVHTAFEPSPKGPAVDAAAVEALLEAARKAVRAGRQAAVLYTSGIWVLGQAPLPTAEDAPTDPAALVAWRPAVEQAVLGAEVPGLRTAVIRPGIVFGGARGIVGDMLRGASNGLIRVIGTGQNRWPLVYHRDLADLYLRIASTATASGVYHATDDSDERVIDIAEAIAAHMQVRPDIRHMHIDEARAKHGPYADAITLDQVVKSPRSRALGWEPGFKSITANVSRLFEEWRRGQE